MNALAVFAHPDDETMLCGGTLALLAQSGWKVHYVCATRGEGGETGQPPLATIEELGSVRELELVHAVGALGGSSLTFLGYVDPRVGPDNQLFAYPANLTVLAGQVAASIQQFEAGLVFTHGSNGEYGHPAHLLTHQAVKIAVESLGQNAPLLYTPQAWYPEHPRPRLANQADQAHLILDVSAAGERKTRAALCHRTQHALFVRKMSEDLGRPVTVPETIVLEESLHRAFPPVQANDRVSDALEETLARYKKPRSVL